MTIEATTIQEAAEVLAGHTPYSNVTYRGITFHRAKAVWAMGAGGDISIEAAKRYIRERVYLIETQNQE